MSLTCRKDIVGLIQFVSSTRILSRFSIDTLVCLFNEIMHCYAI